MMDFDRDVDFVREEHEQHNGPPPGFCASCGFVWSVHSSRKVGPGGWKGPHGCPPSETEARLRWGR